MTLQTPHGWGFAKYLFRVALVVITPICCHEYGTPLKYIKLQLTTFDDLPPNIGDELQDNTSVAWAECTRKPTWIHKKWFGKGGLLWNVAIFRIYFRFLACTFDSFFTFVMTFEQFWILQPKIPGVYFPQVLKNDKKLPFFFFFRSFPIPLVSLNELTQAMPTRWFAIRSLLAALAGEHFAGFRGLWIFGG